MGLLVPRHYHVCRLDGGPLLEYMTWEAGPARWWEAWTKQPTAEKFAQATAVLAAGLAAVLIWVWLRKQLWSLRDDNPKAP
jgi:hypothetical protein